jgi:hypothetical protein
MLPLHSLCGRNFVPGLRADPAGCPLWPFTSFVTFCVWRLLVEADKRYSGGPRIRRGHALSRGRTTARPSPQAVSALSGHDRSAKNSGASVRPLP